MANTSKSSTSSLKTDQGAYIQPKIGGDIPGAWRSVVGKDISVRYLKKMLNKLRNGLQCLTKEKFNSLPGSVSW